MLPKKRSRYRKRKAAVLLKRSRYRKRKAAVLLTGIAVLAVAAVFAAGMWKKYQRGLEGREAISSGEIKKERGEVEFVYNDHLSNYLFMGVDTEGEAEDATARNAGQADAIFLLSMNRVTGEINTVSIPRDTMTEIEAFSVGGKSLGMMKNHINLQYAQERGEAEFVYNDHLSNYLFMGVDTEGEAEDATARNAGQADAIFLLSMNRVTGEINTVSIPRDTMTEIEAFSVGGKSLGMMKNHINLQYAQGDGKHKSCELMKTKQQFPIFWVEFPFRGTVL